MDKKESLIEKIKKFDRIDEVKKRIDDFKNLHNQEDKEWFKELCFCILTANFSAEGGIKIQKEIKDGFLTLDQKDLEEKLKELGHRYYKKRAEYIVLARKYKNIKSILLNNFKDEFEMREFLVRNIKGLGYKEASHFLRNVGFDNVAIIDRHILRILYDYGYIDEIPKSLTRKKYLKIETILKEIGSQTGYKLSELDLILWSLRTGKILK